MKCFSDPCFKWTAYGTVFEQNSWHGRALRNYDRVWCVKFFARRDHPDNWWIIMALEWDEEDPYEIRRPVSAHCADLRRSGLKKKKWNCFGRWWERKDGNEHNYIELNIRRGTIINDHNESERKINIGPENLITKDAIENVQERSWSF